MKPGAHSIVLLVTGIFFSILFLQSGLDKVFNWKSELGFNKKHFEKTFLRSFTALMLVMLTLIELTSGALSVTGIFMLLKTGETAVLFYAGCFSASTFLCLFFGQRISKDYGGSQSLVSYFIVSLIELYLSFPG